nr:hypothetical protein [Rhodococcus sp. (in: high G+C Gram-positive bacteria)]
MELPQGKYGCEKCGAIWGGANTCHCAGCHLTFVGITAFDKHRSNEYSRYPHGLCKSPADAGLEQAPDRAYPALTIAGKSEEEAE